MNRNLTRSRSKSQAFFRVVENLGPLNVDLCFEIARFYEQKNHWIQVLAIRKTRRKLEKSVKGSTKSPKKYAKSIRMESILIVNARAQKHKTTLL